jgi:predicted nucleic acid-binding protein
MDAFDADVLIYAAERDHPLGRAVLELFSAEPPIGVGSVLLLPEVLSKPTRLGDVAQVDELISLLAQLDLVPVDRALAQAAAELGAAYRLRVADATHLATAVQAGADRFITNNRRDFPQTIEAVDVVYPDDLPDPEETDHG